MSILTGALYGAGIVASGFQGMSHIDTPSMVLRNAGFHFQIVYGDGEKRETKNGSDLPFVRNRKANKEILKLK